MNVKTLCLAILNKQDATGYEIKKLSTDGKFQHFVQISYGSIYPTLAKLEMAGLVTCSTQTQTGKPDRKVYSISDAGRIEFSRSINVMPKPDKFTSGFLLMSINAGIVDREILLAAFEENVRQSEEELQMLNEMVCDCDNPSLLWTVRSGIATLEAKLAYFKEHKDELLQMAGTAKHELPDLQAAE